MKPRRRGTSPQNKTQFYNSTDHFPKFYKRNKDDAQKANKETFNREKNDKLAIMAEGGGEMSKMIFKEAVGGASLKNRNETGTF